MTKSIPSKRKLNELEGARAALQMLLDSGVRYNQEPGASPFDAKPVKLTEDDRKSYLDKIAVYDRQIDQMKSERGLK